MWGCLKVETLRPTGDERLMQYHQTRKKSSRTEFLRSTTFESTKKSWSSAVSRVLLTGCGHGSRGASAGLPEVCLLPLDGGWGPEDDQGGARRQPTLLGLEEQTAALLTGVALPASCPFGADARLVSPPGIWRDLKRATTPPFPPRRGTQELASASAHLPSPLSRGAARYQKQASSNRVSYANFACEWYHRTSGLGQGSPPLPPAPS
nr:PREDICTED: uncharacterized protein LOC109444937 isoform X2 [Rhinolophus sinicus]